MSKLLQNYAAERLYNAYWCATEGRHRSLLREEQLDSADVKGIESNQDVLELLDGMSPEGVMEALHSTALRPSDTDE